MTLHFADRELHVATPMSRGFSLVETLLATTVFTVALVSIAQLAVLSTRANENAASTTMASALAAEKLEQLRALAWTFDPAGAPVSDTSTDTATPGMPSGGTGLSISPSDSLVRNTAGYCDFLDADGHALGGGSTPPPTTVFVRRWSIEALPVVSTDALILRALVTRIGSRRDDTRLLAIRTRKGG